MESTRRQQIAQLLREKCLGAIDIAREVRAPVKTILDDLSHIRQSIKDKEKWCVIPAECKQCGFTFQDRTRLTTPSRCPECRSENIADAAFGIIQRIN